MSTTNLNKLLSAKYGHIAPPDSWMSHNGLRETFTSDIETKLIEQFDKYEWALVACFKVFNTNILAAATRMPGGCLMVVDDSYIKDETLAGYRLLGQAVGGCAVRKLGSPDSSPNMHHKFVVFGNGSAPLAVWDGSFNFTYNAGNSLENASIDRDAYNAIRFTELWVGKLWANAKEIL